MSFNKIIIISTVKIYKSDLVKYDLSKYFPSSKFEIWDLNLIFNKRNSIPKTIEVKKKTNLIRDKRQLKK